MSPQWPERVRLPRGRHTHAAGYASGHADRITPCDCPACKRATEQ